MWTHSSPILNLSIRQRRVVRFTLRTLAPVEYTPGTQWVGCRVDSRASLDAVKVKLSLCLVEHHAMKAYWGSGCIAPLIL
jgi:hypothetical protein